MVFLCSKFIEFRWEVITIFIDIGGIDDHHCLSFWCRRGRDRMVVGFTTTYAISAYNIM